jgi:DNA-binding GntR family transcriptional regulator
VETARPAIVDVLRDAIRQGLLPPGMTLVQSSVAEALGVSRIPVREAFQFLASEGLLAFTDDGVRVTSLSADEVYELYSLNALVEPAMAASAARHVRPDELATLERLASEIEAAASVDAWLDANHTFHLTLHATARMPHHATVARRMLTQIEIYSRLLVDVLDARPDAEREHRAMVEALAQGDAERLKATLEHHSLRARDVLVRHANDAVGTLGQTASTTEAARLFARRLHGDAG